MEVRLIINLKEKLKVLGMTATELSQRSNIAYKVILQFLNEKKKTIKLQHLVQIAEALGIHDIREIISLEIVGEK